MNAVIAFSDEAAAFVRESSKDLIEKGVAFLEGRGPLPQHLLVKGHHEDPSEAVELLTQLNPEQHETLPAFITEALEQVLAHRKQVDANPLAHRDLVALSRLTDKDQVLFSTFNMVCDRVSHAYDPENCKLALRLGFEVLYVLPVGTIYFRHTIYRVGNLVLTRWEKNDNDKDLDLAINMLDFNRAIMPETDALESRLPRLASLSYALSKRGSSRLSLEDLDRAIRVGKELIRMGENSLAPSQSAETDWPEPVAQEHRMIAQIVRNERANIQSRWLGRYEISGDDRDRRQAIEWTKLATAMATSSRERTVLWSTLSKLSYGRYEKTDDRFSLEEAIRTARLAFDEAPDDLQVVQRLATYNLAKFELTGQLSALEESISRSTRDINPLTTPEHYWTFKLLQARAWAHKAEHTKANSDWEHALLLHTKWAQELSEILKDITSSKPLGPRLRIDEIESESIEIGGFAIECFTHTSHAVSWVIALTCTASILTIWRLQESAGITPSSASTGWSSVPSEKRGAAFLRCTQQAVGMGEVMVDNSSRAAAEHTLRLMHDVVSRVTGRKGVSFLDVMLLVLTRPLEILITDGSCHDAPLDEFREMYDKFGMTNAASIEDRTGRKLFFPSLEIGEAIPRSDRSTELSGSLSLQGAPKQAAPMNTVLSPTLFQTLQHMLTATDVGPGDEATHEVLIRLARGLAHMRRENPQDQCEALNQLASLLQIRSAWTGSLDDVLEARSAATKALTLLAPASPFRSTVLFTLATIYRTLFLHQGDSNHLSDCIKHCREAAPGLSPVAMGERILPYCYIMRLDYEHFGSRQSLDEAIDMAQKVRQMQDFSHAPRRMGLALLVTLGELLFARFQLTENEADLTSAIEAVTIASTSHGSDTSEQARSKVSLARYLGILARIRKDEVLLREAYKHTIQVMELAETNGLPAMDRGNALLHVGLVLVEQARGLERAGIKSRSDCLLEAERAIRLAIDLCPAGSKNGIAAPQALSKVLLARTALERETHSALPPALSESLSSDGKYVTNPRAPIPNRISAGRGMAAMQVALGRYSEALTTYDTLTKLVLEHLSFSGDIFRVWPQEFLQDMTRMVEDAAVCAIHHGETSDYALKLLERGAGMALRPLFELRSPTEVPEGLVTGYCEALRRFNRLRVHSESRLLSGPHAGASHSATPDDLTLDEALAELRKTEGFEQALGELNTDQILSLARDGPIVVVFASETVDQAFMIAITESRIIRARFPGVSYAEAKERLEKMQRQVCKGPPPLLHARNKAMRDMLSWLWDAIVRPILDALGITEINPETLPWVHWMGVGVMSFAPFHAAGNGADSAMARCISSYCISLHSLHYARSRPRPPYFNRRDDAKLVAIAMPESPEGYHPLSEAMTEAMITCVLIQKREALRSTGDDPADKDPINILHQPGEVTKDRVLQALSTYNIVHLVCHGVADPQNPANSHLILQDGRLSVAEIAKEYATNADLAYLSACSTARCETQLSLTENLHIAASLQLVGFRNVIGTLWEAWDWASLAVSARFYAALFWTGVDLEADGGNPEDSGPWNPRREVAASLHAAVTSLRAENENSPLLWASYVHYGG